MDEAASITYCIPHRELIDTLWKRMIGRPRLLGSLLFWACLGGGVLILGGPRFYSGAAALMLYALTRPIILRRSLVRAVMQQPSQLEPRTLTFDAVGVAISGSDWETRRGWRHFKGYSADERYLFLDVTESGLGIVVPRQSLSAAQMALLAEYAKAIPARGQSRGVVPP